MVQLAKQALSKMLDWVRFPVCHTKDLKNGTCGLFSLVLGGNGRVHGNGSREVLPMTHHQCSIHCEGSGVAYAARKQRCSPHRPLDSVGGTASSIILKFTRKAVESRVSSTSVFEESDDDDENDIFDELI